MELEVYRPKQFADKVRDYQLWIDDKKVANIKPNDTQVISLPKGCKKLKATIDWCSSPEFLVSDIKDGRVVVKNAFAGNFFKATLLPLYYISFGRKKCLAIESGVE